MLFNVGIDARIKDNMRFGLSLRSQPLVKYNVDNAVSANFGICSDVRKAARKPFSRFIKYKTVFS